jgi:hypothetical protein
VTSIGSASLSVIPDFDGFGSKLSRGASGPLSAAGTQGGTVFGDAAGKSAGSRFSTIFKNAAKAGLIGLAGAGALAVKFGVDAVNSASDLEESTNKVAQVFGKSADDVFKFTKNTADALGQSNTAARDAAATFGIFGNAAGLADKKNAKFAKRMTRLASDLASFNNTEPEEAVQALGAALRGESEPIRAYGVMLDEATLKAEAMALGILEPVKNQAQIKAYQVAIMEGQKNYNEAVKESGKESLEALKAEASLGTARDRLKKATEGTIPPLTQQQKLLAAQSQIFKQTEVAQGDFARTSDGLANQQRRLAARFEDAKAKLGKGLLPIMTDAADFLLDKGIPAFEDFSKWFNKTGIPAIKNFGGQVRDRAKDVKDLIDQFNDMPGWAKKALVSGGLTVFAASKILPKVGGGGAGTGGTLTGLVTKAKPLPVYVVNNGVGGTGGGTGGGPGRELTKFGKMLPVIGAGGVVVGALVGSVYGTKIQSERFAADSETPSGLNPGSRVLTGRGFGSDDPDKTARAYVNLGNQYDLSKEKLSLFRDEAVKFNSTVDKTPRQVEVLFKSKGYMERMREIELLNAALATVGAGGVPNSGAETTPRGFGSDGPVFGAGSNVTITANTTAEIAAAGREHKRKRNRAGWN